MSSAPQSPGSPPATTHSPPTTPDRNEVLVVSHSNLFYWWPVWAIAFVMGVATYVNNHYMVTVPARSQVLVDAEVRGKHAGKEEHFENREVVVLSEKGQLPRTIQGDSKSEPSEIRLHMANKKSYGVIFCVSLLLVIVITNVPLRGMWSVVVIITIILLSVIFALAGWWEQIFHTIALLDIRINMGAYFFIAIGLFAIWLVTLLFFDRQIYIVFTPGQFKVCTEIGGGERVYDTVGMQLERQKGDLFRHYILGLGSGDLIVRTTGAQSHHFDLPNVLFISKKVQMIEDLLQKKKVVESR